MLPYLLEAAFPNSEAISCDLNDISLLLLPRHRLIKWDSAEKIKYCYKLCAEGLETNQFDQDYILDFLMPGTPSHFPGTCSVGSIGCNLTLLQAINSRRKFGSEKESLPYSSKKDLGQYDTPFWLAKRAVTNALCQLDKKESQSGYILDPMAGEGAFLEAALHVCIVQRAQKTLKARGAQINWKDALKSLDLSNLPKLVGIEIDKKRSDFLGENFNNIFKANALPQYRVARNVDFFETETKDFTDCRLIVSNPCWDVIESTNSVRSRKTNQNENIPKQKNEKLFEQRLKIVNQFNKYFNSNISYKDARNIYVLTILHCLNNVGLNNPVSFIVPRGLLGDRGTSEIRRICREARPKIFIDDFKNKASGSRIFSAVDARVQFCILSIVPSENVSSGLEVFHHDILFAPNKKPIVIPWSLVTRLGGKHEIWVTVKNENEKRLLEKLVSYPQLSAHNQLHAYAGNSSNKGANGFEGKDIEMFRLRKLSFKETSVSGSCLLVRKILPNGGKKLIAAPSPTVPPISDSLLCIRTEKDENYSYYLSGILNSTIGEYRLRIFQSNMNLNLWRLLEFQAPEYHSKNSLHKQIVKSAKDLEKQFTNERFRKLDALVAELFTLSDIELNTVSERTLLKLEAA